jgi:predicted nuclease of restriction endonuclease-like RecB superfamily
MLWLGSRVTLPRQPRNTFEKDLRRQLRRAKVAFTYESRKIPYVIAGHYLPDFTVTVPNGEIIIEGKGHFRPEDKRKMVAVKKCNPQLDIRIVFYSSKLSDIKWCKRHGFKYAIKRIPKEWLMGM